MFPSSDRSLAPSYMYQSVLSSLWHCIYFPGLSATLFVKAAGARAV